MLKMPFEIQFYANVNGDEPVKAYILELASQSSKESRIKLNKIQDYLQLLALHGTHLGQPYVKHIEGDVWELRPLKDRIFFFCWQGDRFILLHHFVKKTQKTPRREIDQAIRNMNDHIERSTDDEE